ncbi:MAG TPA: DUF4287 domain-containing protein [Nocardioidaceae bacterium]|jgi:hypothetical protein|nr:DUF4287 domain-containing protein [Nocardioidaceae bacterium]
MALNHSEETHQLLVAKVPTATGRELPEWFGRLDSGPAMSRFADRVNWLRQEYGISHGHATAIVHEYDLRRAHRAFE